MKKAFLSAAILLFLINQVYAQRPSPDTIETEEEPLIIQPIHHGTLALIWNDLTIYVDPTGGEAAFEGLDQPDMILVTDIHGDHMNAETLNELNTGNAILVAPQAVADQIPEPVGKERIILANGETASLAGISIKATPMYNLPETEDSRHPKGRGNGYVLTIGGKNIYISGDTEDIPEMRNLQNIDIAFVCMNLPYTMDVKQAASAVLDFAPDIVYPFHYRGQDTEAFKKLVNDENSEIEVRLKDWYAGN